jgi:hypothetical protein
MTRKCKKKNCGKIFYENLRTLHMPCAEKTKIHFVHPKVTAEQKAARQEKNEKMTMALMDTSTLILNKAQDVASNYGRLVVLTRIKFKANLQLQE